MKYQVRIAQTEDLPRIEEIYAFAREFMKHTGNPNQWGNTHPPRDQLLDDIDCEDLFVIFDEESIHGVFYFKVCPDPTYALIWDGNWHGDSPYGTIHRIAGDGSGGILRTAVEFCSGMTDHIRIDTHHDNIVMQNAILKCGFQRAGIIRIADGSPRIAYDKIVNG